MCRRPSRTPRHVLTHCLALLVLLMNVQDSKLPARCDALEQGMDSVRQLRTMACTRSRSVARQEASSTKSSLSEHQPRCPACKRARRDDQMHAISLSYSHFGRDFRNPTKPGDWHVSTVIQGHQDTPTFAQSQNSILCPWITRQESD